MIDAGKDIQRSNKSAIALAKRAEKGFIEGWLLDNQQNFVEVMNLIKEGAPVQYAKLYLEAYKMGLVRETNININIDRQRDRDDLQALVRTRIKPELTDQGAYTPYEEIKPKRIPIKKDNE